MAEFRTGFIAVVGRPNVGKSTLINALLGQKIAAVSPRPQTTRRRQLGILTMPEAQLVLVDTPGIHHPHHKLGEFMNEEAEASLEGADAVLWIIDLSVPPEDEDIHIAELLRGLHQPPAVIIGANKSDLLATDATHDALGKYVQLAPAGATACIMSATTGRGLEDLVSTLVQRSPVGAAQFADDQVTDLYEREIAADLIREAALFKLRDEVPHGMGVRIEEYAERENDVDYIRATLLVERDSQKAIVIGHEGRMLKQIGTAARREIETMTGRRAYLELRVKVEKGWRNRVGVLEQLGYRSRR